MTSHAVVTTTGNPSPGRSRDCPNSNRKVGRGVPEILACKVVDLNDGESMRVEHDPDDIAIFRVEGQFYATADLCTHEDWSLGEESDLDGHEVECCLHQARFDVRTGAATCYPATIALKTFSVRVVDDEVWVDV
jgi:nitrite reductase/ring-hydroxylating ferredoxin subunit